MARQDDDAEARLLASRELGKANRAILAIRNFYIANAMIAGLVLAVLLLGKAGPLYTVIGAVIFVLALAGIRGVRSEPFLWTLGAASVWTLLVALQVATGAWRTPEGKPTLPFIVACLWTLGCWMLLSRTRRVRDVLREHPDLWISRKMRGRGKRR
jgi:uncharacterized MAPEG superfamily protein